MCFYKFRQIKEFVDLSYINDVGLMWMFFFFLVIEFGSFKLMLLMECIKS